MKILLINVHSFHNAGDFALTLESLKQLYRIFPGCSITIAMNDPDSYSRMSDGLERVVPSFFSWYKRNPAGSKPSRIAYLLLNTLALMYSPIAAWILRLAGERGTSLLPEPYRSSIAAYLDADIVVSVGGNFIYSRGHKLGLPLLMPMFTIAYGRFCGKPLYMLPQTIGPIYRWWERAALGRILKMFRLLLLRDPKSDDLVQTLNIGDTHCIVSPDMAFLHKPAADPEAEELFHKVDLDGDRPLMGVTLINWASQYPPFTSQRQYEQAVADTIRHFVTVYGGEAVLFAQVCGPTEADDDRIPARRVYEILAAQNLCDRVHIIDEELPPSLLQAAYGRMNLFMGSRLHSNIFALTQSVPVLAIAYQDKTIGVMRMLGMEEWTIRIQDVDSVRLITLLDRLWRQRTGVEAQISENVAQLQQQTEDVIDRIAEDYTRWSEGRT